MKLDEIVNVGAKIRGWPAPVIKCKDGIRISVQGHRGAYSSPRDNEGPYHEVEVCVYGCMGSAEWRFEGGDESEAYYAYVPVADVRAFIDAHGGEE